MDLLQLGSPDEAASSAENNEADRQTGEQQAAGDANAKAEPSPRDGETAELLEGVTDKEQEQAAESREKPPSEFKQGHPYAPRVTTSA